MKRQGLAVTCLSLVFLFFTLTVNSQTAAIPTDYLNTVQKLYIGYYQRSADPGGLVFWVNGLSTIDTNHDGNFIGEDVTWVLEQFAYSDEARNLYGGDITSSNIATVIDSIYLGLFGRHAEADGLAWWIDSFNSGASTPATILWELMKGAQGTDAQTVQNRLVAANRFTQIVDPNLDGLPPFQVTYGANDIPAVRIWLAGVTWDPATVPSQDQTIAWMKSNIADPGDPILSQTPGTPEASATVGSAGGTVEVANPLSPLFGVRVEIPRGALNSDVTVSIAVQSTPPGLPDNLYPVGAAILLSPDGTSFNVPITLSIPYKTGDVVDENTLNVYTYEKETLAWNMLTLVDRNAGVVRALIQHFSDFQAAGVLLPNGSLYPFEVSTDAFTIANFHDPPIFSDPGKCNAMSKFSAWYWKNKRQEGSLSTKYSVTEQAKCEATQVIRETDRYLDSRQAQVQTNDPGVATHLKQGISAQEPQILMLSDALTGAFVHVVLAYKYVTNPDSSVSFYIYDPSNQGDSVFITYVNGKFQSYDAGTGKVWIRFGFEDPWITQAACTDPNDRFGACAQVFEDINGLKMMPTVSTKLPEGTVTTPNPTVSAAIDASKWQNPGNKSPRTIDTNTIKIQIDNPAGNCGSLRFDATPDGSEVTVFCTPGELLPGNHSVLLHASDSALISICPVPTVWTFDVAPCQNIAGQWSGTAFDGFDSLPITLSLSQVGCDVTGTITSPASCPGQCGNPTSQKAILGTVNGATFPITISRDPTVDCDTCELICYGTDKGTLTIATDQIQGTVQVQDCETGGSDPVSINLTRSGSASIFSPSTAQRTTAVKKSSLLHRACQ